MTSIMSSILRRGLQSSLRRQFHLSKRLWADDDRIGIGEQTMDISQPFILKPIISPHRTIREHDNCGRQKLYDFGLYVAACMPKYVQMVQMQFNDELEIMVCPEGMFPVLNFMRYHTNACFYALSFATAIDVPYRDYRFEVVYGLLSLRFNQRARIKTYTDELTPLHSAYELWKVCDTFEREIYDFFGIIFTHHPDLRRIMTDYGFEGHPLRKDFPCIGYTEVRYDDELKKLVYEPVEFSQEFRRYRLNSPWNYSKHYQKPAPKGASSEDPSK